MIFFLINICTIFVSFLLFRFSKKFSILFIVVISITTIASVGAFKDSSIKPTDIHDQIIYSLDRCAAYFPVQLCRILYNKPSSIMSVIFIEFLSYFSSENIMSFVIHQYRPIVTLFCYIGIIQTSVITKKHSIEWVLISFLLSYAIVGSFTTIKSFLVLANSGTLVIFSCVGFFSIIRLLYRYAHNRK